MNISQVAWAKEQKWFISSHELTDGSHGVKVLKNNGFIARYSDFNDLLAWSNTL